MSELRGLQEWMLEVISHPHGIEAGLRDADGNVTADAARRSLTEVIEPSRTLSAERRLAVYSDAYFSRLLECLSELYPATVALLGKEDFQAFAAAYLVAHPPASYTLNRLADRFTEYLETTRPTKESEEPDWSDLLIDLVRLETTIDEVFDSPGAESSPPLDLDRLMHLPAEQRPQVRFIPSPSLRLLTFHFPMHNLYTALRRGESPLFPSAATSHEAVARRDYIVRRMTLAAAEFQLLSRLATGATLGEVIENAAEEIDAERLYSWFAAWGRERLIVGWEL